MSRITNWATRRTGHVAGVAAAVGLAVLLLPAPVHADTNMTAPSAIAVVGDQSMSGVSSFLSQKPAGQNPDWADYSASSGAMDSSGNFPAASRPVGVDCTFSRPMGGGDAKVALTQSMKGGPWGGSTNVRECIGAARSGTRLFPVGNAAAPTGSLARIPWGSDAIAPAVRLSSTIGKRFTLDFLKTLYSRNGAAGTGACLGVIPLLPKFGSDVRSVWAYALGIEDYDFSGTGGGPIGRSPQVQTWGSCVTGGAAEPLGFGKGAGNGNAGDRSGQNPIPDGNGTVLDSDKTMIPYPTSTWLSQASGIITDLRGPSSLAAVDFTTVGDLANSATYQPVTANLRNPLYSSGAPAGSPSFSGPRGDLTRTTYIFVPRALIDSLYTPPPSANAFAGASTADRTRFEAAFAAGVSSTICSASTLQLFGLNPIADCGIPTLNP